MGEYSEAFVAFDVAKTNTVAIADGGRGGGVRFLGEVAEAAAVVERLIGKLAGRYGKIVCYEASPTSYGLYGRIEGALGHPSLVVARP